MKINIYILYHLGKLGKNNTNVFFKDIRICLYIYLYIHLYTDILYKISGRPTVVVLPPLGSIDNVWRYYSLTKHG